MTGHRTSAEVTAPRGLWCGYLDDYLGEDGALLGARTLSAEFGCTPVRPTTGATLRFLATTLRARAVVEIGTGTGVSGQWLLRGMAGEGVLTSIDVEPEHQRAARSGFLGAGHAPSRLRLINGKALDVLPRLADGIYDLVFADAVVVEYPRYLCEAVRLLRPGGVLALSGVLDADGLDADGPGVPVRGPDAAALREVLRVAAEDERLVPLPTGGDLLVAARAAG